MEIKKSKTSGGAKAQLFSLTSLIFVLLMIVTLLIFVIMSIGYDNLSISSTLSVSSTNYGTLLTKSADTFAYASGSSALSTLYKYEYNASMRQDNFISNLSYYMQSLMVNGTLPNVAVGSNTAAAINAMMGNAIFLTYNSQISSVTGISSKYIVINQTPLQIFQTSPYAMNVRYTENVQINSSSSVYNFDIPVNVSIPLNGTPDLFYAQQGVYRPIDFANAQGSAKVIGNDYAASGNTIGFTYGTVYQIPSTTTCAGLSSAVPSPLNSNPYDTQLILVDSNAITLTSSSCSALNSYGGLITSAITNVPASPYLVFPKSSNVIPLLQNSQPVLIYGPGLAVLNITNLLSEVSSEDYFTSPFASSYSDRVTGNFQRQSPNGIFTLFAYDRQAGVFSSTQVSNVVSQNLPTSTSTLSVSAWVYPTQSNGNRGIVGQGAAAANNWELKTLSGQFDFALHGNADATFGPLALDTWQMITAVYNSGSLTLFVNGNPVATYSISGSPTLNTNRPLYIGVSPSDTSPINFNGVISNVQVYNGLLTNSQVYYLYQQGIEALPASNVPLVGWWLLNGNANDYSGSADTSMGTNVMYSLLPDYTRDSAFVQPIPSNTYPIPGLLSCRNTGQCFAANVPAVYLGDMPLSLGNSGISTAYFNGVSSFVNVNNAYAQFGLANTLTVSAWIYPTSASQTAGIVVNRGSGSPVPNENFGLDLESGALAFSYQGSMPFDASKGSALAPNQWYLVTVTKDGSGNVNYYVNGVQIGSMAGMDGLGSAYTNNGFVNIGTDSAMMGKGPFNGMIADVQIYGSTLSQNEISNLYLNGINGQPVDTNNIVGWWYLNGNANDSSGFFGNGVSNSVSYRFVQLNYSQYLNSNSIGLSTGGATNNEWQTFGFPARP